MFVLSFFSAKGGTGKTTFNMLMASYLKYSLGRRVLLLDADPPEYIVKLSVILLFIREKAPLTIFSFVSNNVNVISFPIYHNGTAGCAPNSSYK